MWFDVGIKRYTTTSNVCGVFAWLWFDVGIKRYTTELLQTFSNTQLWFDVGIKRYTTFQVRGQRKRCCGLM